MHSERNRARPRKQRRGVGMPDDQSAPQTAEALDAERARLIGSIYEVVLRPEHCDSFMEDWSAFVDNAARRLGELQVGAGPSARQLEDPVIEAHFRRAFALFERMGRGETVVPLAADGQGPLARPGRDGVVLEAQPEAEALFGGTVSAAAIRAALEPASAQRFTAFLSAFDRAPASGRFAVLSLAEPPEGAALPGGGLVAVLRAGIAQIDSRSAENFMTPLYPRGTRDREVVDQQGVAEAIIEGYRYTVAQGQKAFQADAWQVTRDWSALVAGSDCPVHLIHGTLDPVVSFRSVSAFYATRPRAHLVPVEGEGQLLLYARADAVLREVGAFARRCLATA